MSAPVVCNKTCGPQKRPVMTFIRHLSVRQQSRSQRRHLSKPAGQQTAGGGTVAGSMSHSHGSNVNREENGQYAASWVDVASELAGEGDQYVTPSVDVNERVGLATSSSRDNAGGVEHPNVGDASKECQSSVMPKSSGTEEQISPHSMPYKIRRATTRKIRTIGAVITQIKRKDPREDEPIGTGSPTQLDSSGSVPPHLQSTQAGAREQTAMESEEIEKLRRDLSEYYSRIAELEKRLETQSKDLETSNSFFNTADKSSDSDVFRALQRLNAEVQQDTTYMADCLAEDFEFENLTADSPGEQASAAQRASYRLGSILVNSLGTSTPEDIPLLLQIAFQAYFASVLSQAVSSWAYEPGSNTFIWKTYKRLRRVEAQAISGRWRSLARGHHVRYLITHPESLVEGILGDVSDIVLAAGCTAAQSDIITKVASKFEEKVSLLIELAGRLSKMFDEVISSDFEVFIVKPGEKFQPKMMEDADDDQAAMEEALVLCATQIGLRKWVPVGALWEKGRKRKIVVLKAKIVLESFLNTEVEE